jgi:putative serine protease PepD
MSQSTEPLPDNWRAPWAAPAPEGVPAGQSAPDPGGSAHPSGTSAYAADAVTPPEPVQPPPPSPPASPPASAPHGDTQAMGYPYQTQPLPPTPPSGPNGPGSPFGGPPPRQPRRPGWGGVVAVGAGAAVLSSLLTAGVMNLTDQQTTTSSPVAATSSSNASQPPAVVNSTGILPNWGTVAAAVEPSVVSVQVENGNSGGEGSGVVLDNQGRILTNNHVVAGDAGGGTITVVLSDGRGYPATVVGTDSSTDLAVIKMKTVPSGLKPAVFGNSAAVKIGDAVMAIGNPLGLSDTVTTGIVSALNRPVRTTTSGAANQFGGSSEQVVTNAIQTDAAINPGNSGGALVDSGGRVIGITSSIASLGSSMGGQSGSIGLGFAIPVNEAKDVADQLVASGTVQHAFLGVTLQDSPVTVDGAQRQAAVIRSVSSGTPASQAGMTSGDAVIGINGQPIASSDSLIGTVRALKPGTKVTLTVVRNSATKDIPLTLAQRPASNG